ncbi:MAG: hypothetical protein KGD73_00995, partial [Candidatus Lokiarchaeota archaeon]|nr:hypothetical protein [Candidatus Lokiarchaeota archaeon]
MAKVKTLNALGYSLNVDVIFDSSATISNMSNFTLTYTEAYQTTNPWIMFNETTNGSELLGFASTIVASGSD